MSETLPPQVPSVESDPLTDAVELSRASNEAYRADVAKFQESQEQATATLTDAKKFREDIGESVFGAAAAAALVVGGGVLLGNALDSHIENLQEKNQQWQQEAEQTQQQLEFDNGLKSGAVTINVGPTAPPKPSVSEGTPDVNQDRSESNDPSGNDLLPSPEQIGDK